MFLSMDIDLEQPFSYMIKYIVIFNYIDVSKDYFKSSSRETYIIYSGSWIVKEVKSSLESTQILP